MAWIVFWIPREHVPSRIGLAATSMLTLIAYRFAMSSVLLPIAYLTRLDLFMIGVGAGVLGAGGGRGGTLSWTWSMTICPSASMWPRAT